MARDILSEYGPDAPTPQAPTASGGGRQMPRDVMGYSPPLGPKGIEHRGVGLGGDNHGNCGTQGPQFRETQSEGPGPRGTDHGMGTNRKG